MMESRSPENTIPDWDKQTSVNAQPANNYNQISLKVDTSVK